MTCAATAPALAQAGDPLDPNTLPILGDATPAPANITTVVWTRTFELSYRNIHWEVLENDGNSRLKLKWRTADATLLIQSEEAPPTPRPKAPAPVGEPAPYKTTLGGDPATGDFAWFDPGDGRPATYIDTVQCRRKGWLTTLELSIPEKHQEIVTACVKDFREIQRSWRWHD